MPVGTLVLARHENLPVAYSARGLQNTTGLSERLEMQAAPLQAVHCAAIPWLPLRLTTLALDNAGEKAMLHTVQTASRQVLAQMPQRLHSDVITTASHHSTPNTHTEAHGLTDAQVEAQRHYLSSMITRLSKGGSRHFSAYSTPVGSFGGPSDSAYRVATRERERWISGSSAEAAFTCGPATNSCLCKASAPGLASGSCFGTHAGCSERLQHRALLENPKRSHLHAGNHCAPDMASCASMTP